jgi:short-subunit dehydrogenase
LGHAFIGTAAKLHPELPVCNLSRSEPERFSAGKNLHHITCDLAREDDVGQAAHQVEEWLEGTPGGRVLLINNSGFGAYGPFPEPNLTRTLQMIDVNVRGTVQLTGLLLPILRQRGGAIMNIASTAGFVPTVYTAVYGATKAFMLHWSLALGEELRGTGLHVIAVCPGTTRTRFFDRAGVSPRAVAGRFTQTPQQVVDEALRALARGRAQVITGWRNRVMIGCMSKLPKPLATRVTAMALRRFWKRQNS